MSEFSEKLKESLLIQRASAIASLENINKLLEEYGGEVSASQTPPPAARAPKTAAAQAPAAKSKAKAGTPVKAAQAPEKSHKADRAPTHQEPQGATTPPGPGGKQEELSGRVAKKETGHKKRKVPEPEEEAPEAEEEEEQQEEGEEEEEQEEEEEEEPRHTKKAKTDTSLLARNLGQSSNKLKAMGQDPLERITSDDAALPTKKGRRLNSEQADGEREVEDSAGEDVAEEHPETRLPDPQQASSTLDLSAISEASPKARAGTYAGGKRRKWFPNEEAALRAGVATYGLGSWAKILLNTPLLDGRTSVNLKDKWRNMNGPQKPGAD